MKRIGVEVSLYGAGKCSLHGVKATWMKKQELGEFLKVIFQNEILLSGVM